MDNRLPSNRTNAIGDRIVEMKGDCERVGITLSRQVTTIPVINSNPAEGASFPNYYLDGSGPRERPGVPSLFFGKASGTGATRHGNTELVERP
jgi:hypothetical protein